MKSLTLLPRPEGGGSRMPPWHVDEIEDMATDLDGSLSALGPELTAASYNMSEALLSLPSLTVFKQEETSPSQENVLAHQNLQPGIEETHDQNITLQRLLQQQNFHSQIKRNNAAQKNNEMSEKNNNCRFQYVLAAATSIATKVTEETLTYLNQGQSYEIKLKKVGELSNFRGKILKSVIRICFHERRLQYMEKEQILAWQASRPGERIVELDVPLSYGLFDVEQDPHMLNMLSFLWDPTKEVGAYIKVNCISTEFTPKKHGGEKGVPFRIQVETFIDGETTRLHAAACQIKVFKLKGADRKHKQDREKILKRPPSEQDKYQPSYECTVLNDLLPDAVFPAPTFLNSSPSAPISKPNIIYPGGVEGSDPLSPHSPLRAPVSASVVSSSSNVENGVALSRRIVDRSRTLAPLPLECPIPSVALTHEFSTQQTAQWLRKNGFGDYISAFSNYTGADILRLTREDLIQICGLADGIRLLYALRSKAIVLLTVYFCTPGSTVFHAVYLDQIGRNKIFQKLASLLGVHHNQIHDIYMQGPNGIRVFVTDEVVGNIENESMFSIEVLQDEKCDGFMLLLKPPTRT
ncbi:UNVERIFIED_CONTAM: hypothetical protein PYX00_010340 [Menopon gallinae]|uniref:Grh/CP2 DB domain-containing protein n=1 Tax=Menopon gallinae TaxID=328185 RepID=A0AAW2HF24_9NEOP